MFCQHMYGPQPIWSWQHWCRLWFFWWRCHRGKTRVEWLGGIFYRCKCKVTRRAFSPGRTCRRCWCRSPPSGRLATIWPGRLSCHRSRCQYQAIRRWPGGTCPNSVLLLQSFWYRPSETIGWQPRSQLPLLGPYYLTSSQSHLRCQRSTLAD